MQRIVRILHILQLRLPAAASASFFSPTAITHLVAGSREGSFCLILFLTCDCEFATHFPLPLHMCACVCVSGICMYISANARAGSNFASASVGVNALPELCLLCNLLCNICNYYCNAANFPPPFPPALYLSPSLHALPCLEPRSWQKVCEKRQVCECLRWQNEDGKKKEKKQQQQEKKEKKKEQQQQEQ